LRSAIEWNDYGFEIVAEASDGEEGAGLIEKLAPDIVLTDICMPIKDGIQLTEEMKVKFPHLSVIILSCYGEFAYVQKAMRLGAFDYLLKSSLVNTEELINTLLKAKEEIGKKKKNHEEMLNIKNRLNISIPAVKQKFLLDLVNSNIMNESEIQAGFSNLGMNFYSDQIFLIAIQINNYKVIKSHYSSNDSILMIEFRLKNILEEIVGQYGRTVVFLTKENNFIVIVDIFEKSSFCSLQDRVISICERARLSTNKFLGFYLSIFIDRNCSAKEIPESYKRIEQVMKYRIFVEENSIVTADDFSNHYKRNVKIDSYTGALMKLINQSDKFYDLLYSLMYDIVANSKSILVFEGICFDLITVYNKCIHDYVHYMADIKKECIEMSVIYEFSSIDEAYVWFKAKYEGFFSKLKQNNVTNCKQAVKDIINYMNNNYCDNISLEHLSEKLHFNKFYICRVFKEETGENITDYILKRRVMKAKELLEDRTLKVYEVANNVGFNDVTYFNRVFKKVVGISPGDYQKR